MKNTKLTGQKDTPFPDNFCILVVQGWGRHFPNQDPLLLPKDGEGLSLPTRLPPALGLLVPACSHGTKSSVPLSGVECRPPTISLFILQAELSDPHNQDQGREEANTCTPLCTGWLGSSAHNSQWVETTQCSLDAGGSTGGGGLARQWNNTQPQKGQKHRDRLQHEWTWKHTGRGKKPDTRENMSYDFM